MAVKRVQPQTKEQATTFVREVEALAQLRHPHVMQLYAACVRPPKDFWLICELLGCDGGARADAVRLLVGFGLEHGLWRVATPSSTGCVTSVRHPLLRAFCHRPS